MKKLLIIISSIFTTSLFSVLMILTPVLAEDPVDGTFNSTGFNNPTEYTQFTIQKVNTAGGLVGDPLNSGANLTPQETYRFSLGISDEDKLDDVGSIQVHFYYVTFDEEALTNNQGTYVVLEWVNGSNEFLVTDGSVTSTWEVTRSAIPDLNEKAGVFSFDLEISKVARFTSAGEWQVGLVVVDGVIAEGYEPKAVSHSAIGVISNGNPLSEPASSFNMDWYGEIDLTERNALWTDVFPNMDFSDEGALVTLSGVKYISNGNYDREIKADDVWNITGAGAADGSTMAALTTDLAKVGANADAESAQLFALKVSVQDNPALPSESNGLVPTAEVFTAFATNKIFTDEDGVTIDVYLWLAISTRFQNATYTGEIVLSVVNYVD